MFTTNLIYEFKLLIRNNWLVLLIGSVALLFVYATFNGNNNVDKRLSDITEMQAETNKKDSILLMQLTKLENGEKLDISSRQTPTNPIIVGRSYPRLAVMNPASLAFIATGQSDMFTHFKSPTVYGNNFALDYSEMVNPVQLLFGNFDLAFVIIYILPLIIIAFTFNVLSKEKELGTLRLLGAQPISVRKWLFQKMSIRYLIFTAISLITLLIAIPIFSPNAFTDMNGVLGLLLLCAGYILFWFVVSFVVNITINESSRNAFALIGVWLLLVLIVPATINQMGNSFYPTPSRLKMINEIRLIKKENEEAQNEIMSAYLRDHPELAQDEGEGNYGFWHRYFASEKMMEEKTKPLLATYESQLKKQQQLISTFQYFSPAILMQQALNNIAGTSEKHYNDYKKQVVEFSDEWRNYFVPMLFNEQKFTKAAMEKMPNFTYQNRIDNNVWINLLAIIAISGLVFILCTKKRLKNGVIQ